MDVATPLPKATGNSFGRHVVTGEDVLTFLTEISASDNIVGITCAGKTDGGGAQVLAVMSTLAYSNATGVPYFHSPFTEVRFDDGNPEWAYRWERFFNLGLGENSLPFDVPVLDASQYIEAGRPSGVIIRVPHCHNFIHRDGTADAYSTTMRERFRRKYASGPNKGQYPDRYIAVHIRRGDVSNDKHSSRFTSSDRILEDLRLFKQRTGSTLPFEVFSQGNEADFDFLPKGEVSRLHLDVDVFETIDRMVCADGLIMGRSSFSYLSALLGDAPVMTDLWYHRPLSTWFVPTGYGDALPWGTIASNKRLTRNLHSRLATDPDGVIAEASQNPRLFEESPVARWCLALAYLRNQPEKAEPILNELALGRSGVANSARRTVANRFSDKRIDWKK